TIRPSAAPTPGHRHYRPPLPRERGRELPLSDSPSRTRTPQWATDMTGPAEMCIMSTVRRTGPPRPAPEGAPAAVRPAAAASRRARTAARKAGGRTPPLARTEADNGGTRAGGPGRREARAGNSVRTGPAHGDGSDGFDADVQADCSGQPGGIGGAPHPRRA